MDVLNHVIGESGVSLYKSVASPQPIPQLKMKGTMGVN